MSPKFAVILSGCGYMDGAEIRESVITILEAERFGGVCDFFAPNVDFVVKDHLSNERTEEKRNVLVEAARIARGHISDIEKIEVEKYDGLLIPGGFGVVSNLSNIGSNKDNPQVVPSVEDTIIKFWKSKKPIGAVCIAPALVACVLSEYSSNVVLVTLGDKKNHSIIEKLGGKYVECAANDFVVDEKNLIFSTPAYMTNDTMYNISQGISKMLDNICKYCKSNK